MTEHLWQFIRRYDQQSPEMYTVRARPYVLVLDGLRSNNLIEDPDYQYAPQSFQRTSQKFNGYPIWQGTRDATVFMVAANIPVREEVGFVDAGRVDRPYIALVPDVSSSNTVRTWKITQAPDIGSISDGLGTYDLVRGTSEPLEKTPGYILGVVEGGDSPSPGAYFRTLQWLSDQKSVFLDQYLWADPLPDCIDNGVPEARPIVVTSGVDLADLYAQAESSCSALGDEVSQLITEFVVEYDASHPLGELFLAQAAVCCGDTLIETSSSSEEGL